MQNHEAYMREAIRLAHTNLSVPFGAVLVDCDSGKLVAEGVNRSQENPTWHGEIVAINDYASRDVCRWDRLRLYSTGEPCCMCQAAILWSGIPEVIFGTSVTTLRELGWKQFAMTADEVTSYAPFADCKFVGGVLAMECDELFRRAR